MKKPQPKKPVLASVRYAIVVTWQPSKVPCEYGFIQAFTGSSDGHVNEDVTELDHIGGRIMPVAPDARIGQRVSLFP